jgi:hypothetical protein
MKHAFLWHANARDEGAHKRMNEEIMYEICP